MDSALAQAFELFADADDGIDGGFQLAADVGERILNCWRRSRLLQTLHDAHLDEVTQVVVFDGASGGIGNDYSAKKAGHYGKSELLHDSLNRVLELIRPNTEICVVALSEPFFLRSQCGNG